jgi:hypothetical protein
LGAGDGYPHRTRDMDVASAERAVARKRMWLMSGARWSERERASKSERATEGDTSTEWARWVERGRRGLG